MSEELRPSSQNGGLGVYHFWEGSREQFGNCSLTPCGSIGVRINSPILSSPRPAGLAAAERDGLPTLQFVALPVSYTAAG